MDVLAVTPRPPCGITVGVRRPRPGAAVVAVAGEVDEAEAQLLERTVAGLDAGVALVVVDLAGVSFFGSRGLAALVLAQDAARRRGVRVHVATGEGNRRVVRPLQITGVDAVVPVFATAAEALGERPGRAG